MLLHVCVTQPVLASYYVKTTSSHLAGYIILTLHEERLLQIVIWSFAVNINNTIMRLQCTASCCFNQLHFCMYFLVVALTSTTTRHQQRDSLHSFYNSFESENIIPVLAICCMSIRTVGVYCKDTCCCCINYEKLQFCESLKCRSELYVYQDGVIAVDIFMSVMLPCPVSMYVLAA